MEIGIAVAKNLPIEDSDMLRMKFHEIFCFLLESSDQLSTELSLPSIITP